MYIPKIKPISQKRMDQLERNHSGRQYQEWRTHILARDGDKCQYPRCQETEKLQVHHIRKHAVAMHLRYETKNGIVLCAAHHKQVTGQEEAYELQFFQMAMANEKLYEASLEHTD